MKPKELAGWLVLLVAAALFGKFIADSRRQGQGGGGTGGVQPTSRPAGPSATRDKMLIYVRATEGGVLIDEVVPGGAGDTAGLRVGDVIIEFEGQPLEDEEPIHARLNNLRAGDSVRMKVRRPEGTVEEVVVRFDEPGTGDLILAKTLIRQGVAQLITVDEVDILTGKWPHYSDSSVTSVGVTALVAYALARAGEDLDEGQQKALDDVMTVLHGEINAEDGGLDESSPVPVRHRVYANALYLMALEAYPKADPKVRQQIADWLQKAQVQEAHGFDPIDTRYGGWSYYDAYGTRMRTDVSTARFALQGLAGADLPEDAPVWQRSSLFLDELQNHTLITGPGDGPLYTQERSMRDGGFSFTPRDGKAGKRALGKTMVVGTSYGSATADGALGLMAVLGIDRRTEKPDALPDDPRVRAALGWLATNYGNFEENPGFGIDSGWSEGLFFYFAAAQAEAFHRAGVWSLELRGGVSRVWAEDLVRHMGSVHGLKGRAFLSDSGLMHENLPSIAAAFAVIGLAAARDRLAVGGGAALEAGTAGVGGQRHVEDLAPPPQDARERGLALMKAPRFGCFACHQDGQSVNGPSLVGVGDAYLARYKTEKAARERLREWLAKPTQGTGLLGGDYANPMQPVDMNLVPKEQVDDMITFLLSCSGKRPVSNLR